MSDLAAIHVLLNHYADALRANDATAAAACFTRDARVVPPGAPEVHGRPAIAAFHEHLMKVLRTDLQFSLDFFVSGADGSVVAFTSSIGTRTLASSDLSTYEVDRQAIVFTHSGDHLAISQYLYNSAYRPIPH